MTTTSAEIISFWFEEIDKKLWFKKDDDFDQLLIDRFSDIHSNAIQSELFAWRATAHGRLAEIIVLDQFSRNMFRGSEKSFSSDPLALALSQEAVAQGFDIVLSTDQRTFLYMPYMHSESLKVHEEAVRLFTALGNKNNLDYEHRHKAIIEKYGRYPHRNQVLGRESTPEEVAFLREPGSSF